MISAIGLIVPSTFDTAVTATIFVRRDKQPIERRQVELKARGDRHPADRGAGARGELLPGDDVAVVLHLGEQDFVAGVEVGVAPAAGDQVDRGGRARAEDDFGRAAGVDQGPHRLAGRFVADGALGGQGVAAAMHVAVVVLVGLDHGRDHLARPLGRSAVVEIGQRIALGQRRRQDRKVAADVLHVERQESGRARVCAGTGRPLPGGGQLAACTVGHVPGRPRLCVGTSGSECRSAVGLACGPISRMRLIIE